MDSREDRDDHDADVLAFYYYKIDDAEERINIINALGEMRDSLVALDALERMARNAPTRDSPKGLFPRS